MENVIIVALLLAGLGISGVFPMLLKSVSLQPVPSTKARAAGPKPTVPAAGKVRPASPPPRTIVRPAPTPSRNESDQLRQLARRLSRLETALDGEGAVPAGTVVSRTPAEVHRQIVALSRGGVDASDVARRLGVSRGEVELVLRMALHVDAR